MTNETHEPSGNVSFFHESVLLSCTSSSLYKATLSFPCSRLSKWTLKCSRLKKEVAALEWTSNLWGVWSWDPQQPITTTILRWDVCATTARTIGKRWEAHPVTSGQGMLSNMQMPSNLTSLWLCKCQWDDGVPSDALFDQCGGELLL